MVQPRPEMEIPPPQSRSAFGRGIRPAPAGFREGDTFVPERILALDEPLAVLHATSQALACCALAPRPADRPDADTVPVPSLP